MRIDVHIHMDDKPSPLLEEIVRRLTTLDRKVDALMAGSTELQNLITALDEKTNALAADSAAQATAIAAIASKIDSLASQLAAGMTPAEVEAIKVGLQAQADKLEAIKTTEDAQTATLQSLGADPANPIPPTP